MYDTKEVSARCKFPCLLRLCDNKLTFQSVPMCHSSILVHRKERPLGNQSKRDLSSSLESDFFGEFWARFSTWVAYSIMTFFTARRPLLRLGAVRLQFSDQKRKCLQLAWIKAFARKLSVWYGINQEKPLVTIFNHSFLSFSTPRFLLRLQGTARTTSMHLLFPESSWILTSSSLIARFECLSQQRFFRQSKC